VRSADGTTKPTRRCALGLLKKSFFVGRRQESFPDDLDWLDEPAGKDSCRRYQMGFSTVPKLWGTREKTHEDL